MKSCISKTVLDSNVVIITEDANEEMCVIQGSMESIMEDWNNEKTFIPPDSAKVYFASYNGKPISPYSYIDLYTLYVYLVEKEKLHSN